MTKVLWKPDQDSINNSNLYHFIKQVEANQHCTFANYEALHQWSITNPAQFWQMTAEFCGIRFGQPATQIMHHASRMQDTQWFQGATLNFAENLLKRNDKHPALISYNESGQMQQIHYDTLQQRVAKLANKLRQLGLTAGDCVAAIVPNTIETVIAMLATTSIGGVWSACSPDFGLPALLDRFTQIKPKLLFTTTAHHYRCQTFCHQARNQALQQELASVAHVIPIEYINALSDDQDTIIHFTQLPFNHPLYILYSSGTTGKPKCMVHGAGGTLLQHLKELVLHTNLNCNTRIFFNTTSAWMMWHWLISSLAVGATVILYDGYIFSPKTRLFDLIDQIGITVFGVGAKFFELCEKSSLQPMHTHKLSSLRTILTTGSPLLPASFDYVYRSVKCDVQLSSISGGSDLISCFALGNPLKPVYRGELQCLGLGMDVQIYNPQGQAVVEEKGELVCTTPFPSMPVYFWNDPDGEKYQQAYFDTFPNVWTHGDYAALTKHQGLIIYGRSDTTLNPGGIRIGSAEIYQQLETIPEIREAVVTTLLKNNNEKILLFVVLEDNKQLSNKLKETIKNRIRENTSPHHVPGKIIAVKDIPRTTNGKISESAVKKAVNGEPIDNLDALANPESLQYFL